MSKKMMSGTGGTPDYQVVMEKDDFLIGVKPLFDIGKHQGTKMVMVGVRIRGALDPEAGDQKETNVGHKVRKIFTKIPWRKVDSRRASTEGAAAAALDHVHKLGFDEFLYATDLLTGLKTYMKEQAENLGVEDYDEADMLQFLMGEWDSEYQKIHGASKKEAKAVVADIMSKMKQASDDEDEEGMGDYPDGAT